MRTKQRKASWWLPAMMMGGMLGVLVVEALDPDLLPIEPGIEMFTVIVGFTLLALWVHFNSGLMQDESRDEYKIHVIDPAAPSKND